MNRCKAIPEGNKISLNRCARMNIDDARRRTEKQTDTCMRTPSTHENVCNSHHHHSRMMIRKRGARARVVMEGGKESERTTMCRRTESGKNAKNAIFFW
jgi:hypothetical protein